MAHYQVKITVQAMRLPDHIPVPVRDPGKDPIGELVGVMRDQMQAQSRPIPYPMYPFRESGLTLGKEVEISVESFQELAKALGMFDELADRIRSRSTISGS
jgi:hypothetical protein